MANGGTDDDVDLTAVLGLLGKLVDVSNLQADLQRATNALLVEVVRNTGTPGKPPGGGAPNPNPTQRPTNRSQRNQQQNQPNRPVADSNRGLEALFAKYFGKDSKYVDPQKGLGRWAGKKAEQQWKGSRSRRYGKTVAKFAMGAARSLGAGKKTTKAAGMVGGVVGKVTGAVTSVVDAFLKARNAVAGWTDSALASATKLGEISGEMAQVALQREVNQIYRDVERGQKTAGTAGKLQEAESRRKDEENKIGVFVDNASNKILTVLNDLVTPILEGVNKILKVAELFPGPIGALMKKLNAGDEVGEGTFPRAERDAAAVVAGIEARAGALMDAARRAGGAGTGVSSPSGAMPPGRVR